jgi:hypothetical protein
MDIMRIEEFGVGLLSVDPSGWEQTGLSRLIVTLAVTLSAREGLNGPGLYPAGGSNHSPNPCRHCEPDEIEASEAMESCTGEAIS